MAPLVTLLSTFFLAFLIYFLFRLLFNRPRHLPPGPKGWPIVGNLPQLGSQPHRSLTELARKYGPLMHLRLGSVHLIVASSPSVASLFLKTHDGNFSNRPPNSGAKHMAYNYHDLVFAPYGPQWRRLRKICAVHMFSTRALDDYRNVRERELASIACAMAESEGRKDVNLGQIVNVYTSNVLGMIMIGKRVFEELGRGDRKEAEEFKEMVVELMQLAGLFNVGDFVPILYPFDPQGVVKRMKNLHKRFDDFLNRIMEERKKGWTPTESSQPDLLTVLLGMKDSKGKGGGDDDLTITETEIKALLLNMLTAGTDTSSSTVEWAIAELIRHPDMLATAQHELDTVVGRDQFVSESDLPNLPFLQAVIKETFRLHPPTPLSVPRLAAEKCEINGYSIPKNSTLFINVWAIGRDPSVWADPLEFRPSRFLSGGEHAHVDLKGNDFELIPFGAGRRICAGMNLGLRTVQFVTAFLIQSFNWALPDGQLPQNLNMEETCGITLQRVEPLTVCPLPRLVSHLYRATN